MVKSSKKGNKSNKNNSKGGQSRPRKGKKGKSNGGAVSMGIFNDPRVRSWYNLLRDPCNSPLSVPCYTGADSGYLLRTVSTISPIIAGTYQAGAITFGDATVQFTPYNLSGTSGWMSAACKADTDNAPAVLSGDPLNFICGPSVKRYRPIACCLKYIPYGPFATRAGLVGMSSVPGIVLGLAGDIINHTNMTATHQHITSAGSENHEVRWLPTEADEKFSSIANNSEASAGTVILTLKGVDATARSGTTATFNGIIEATTCWEWQPATMMGVISEINPPLPYSSQEVIGAVPNLREFIHDGARAAVRTVANVAVTGAMRYITMNRGVAYNSLRG